MRRRAVTTLKVSIPDELMAIVDARIAEGRYGSADEYFQALLERDERRLQARRDLEDKLQEAVDDGPGEPLTPTEWDSMRREALNGLAGEEVQS
jgi:putative addiction module CopG family antidote